MAKYFGTNGVRGLFDNLNPALALKLSTAIGQYFGRGRIIVARDFRLTGETLKHAVLSGLLAAGCEVIDIDLAPAPTAELMIKHLGASGCIIITASHNPPQWNALKVVDGKGIAISHERGEEIERLMNDGKMVAWDKVGKVTTYSAAIADHINLITANIERTKLVRKKIVLDCGNGTASLIAPRLLRDLGMEVITLNEEPDGRFPGRPSEPTETNVRELLSAVVAHKADAGIAWDGDGDRVIFVDERGSYIIGDIVFALSVLWLGNREGDIVTTVATSKAIADVADRIGSRVRYTAIGAPYLSEEMAKRPAAIGGEEVGGVIWPALSLAKDGFYTAAKMVEAVSRRPLSQWRLEIPFYHNVKRKIEASGKAKERIVARVLTYAKKKKLNYRDIDGVRIDFPQSSAWVIVRASGTENYVRVFAEAKTNEEATQLAGEYEKIARTGTN